jgi:hypothetical protein
MNPRVRATRDGRRSRMNAMAGTGRRSCTVTGSSSGGSRRRRRRRWRRGERRLRGHGGGDGACARGEQLQGWAVAQAWRRASASGGVAR